MNVKEGVTTNISVVLNGGRKEMNSATIPIKWWLSEEVIKKAPKYILIFEQDEEEKNDLNDAMYRGRRYLCKVSDAFKFISVFSPGYHRIMVLAIQDISHSSVTAGDYLKKERNGSFVFDLDWEKAERGGCGMRFYISAATVVEFEIPEELFAKKPETKASQFVWKWANKWYDDDPQDECDYRRRKMFALPLMAAWLLLKHGIGGTVHALYVLLASFATFFFGFRPRPIFREMWRAFTFKRYGEWDVSRYGCNFYWGGRTISAYRVWDATQIKKDDGYVRGIKYMPVAPFVAALISGAGVGAYYLVYLVRSLISGRLAGLLPYAIGIACIIIVVLLSKAISPYFRKAVSKGIRKLKENAEKEAFVQKKTRQDMEQKWMLKNLALSQKTEAVHLDRLPTPPDLRGKVVQRFYVSYWTLKAKVCRPFAK